MGVGRTKEAAHEREEKKKEKDYTLFAELCAVRTLGEQNTAIKSRV